MEARSRRAGVAHHLDLAGPGLDHPHGDEPLSFLLHDMGAEDGEGVPVTGADEEVEVLLPEGGLHRPSIVAETEREGAAAVAGPCGTHHRCTRNVISSMSFPPPRDSTEATTR